MGISRATTFPMQAPAQANNLQRTSLDSNRFQTNTMSNPNLRQSFYELMSPSTDMSPIGTPESSSTSHSLPQYNMQPQFGINTAVPDLGAMMFPSADPFAYPNQPMMEFDNIKQENVGMMGGSPVPPIYLSSGGPTREFDDLQGQLFGPLPPYLTQAPHSYDLQGQMGAEHMMGGQNMNYNAGVPTNEEMNFDGIFSGDGEDWNNMLAEQRYR